MESRKELSFDQNPKDYHFDRNCQEFTIPRKGLSLSQSKEINEIYLQFSLIRLSPERGMGS